MDNGTELSAKPEDNQGEDVSQTGEARIGSGLCHPNAPQINAEIKRLMRSPFQRVLMDYLGYAPTADAIRRLADKAPDRWIQGAVMLAQLAGYQKEVHVTGEVSHVHSMSDAEIQRRVTEGRARMREISLTAALPIPAPQAGNVSRETPAMAANRNERDAHASAEHGLSALKPARANAEAPIDVQARVIPD